LVTIVVLLWSKIIAQNVQQQRGELLVNESDSCR